eukprot:CAMPEP_0196740888 /NCGR_PEP_ID=MMETSP1091-20130531/35990_1 /TAXON_ID=302021 /ORGANISM="Rhodomonas sp., Strain CCMP768" /LENGTH=59 /DNA_ID=CAMNT_0042086287 /DNA_START=34 /DNA_END=210 /DNA_ORIENTATION=+
MTYTPQEFSRTGRFVLCSAHKCMAQQAPSRQQTTTMLLLRIQSASAAVYESLRSTSFTH